MKRRHALIVALLLVAPLQQAAAADEDPCLSRLPPPPGCAHTLVEPVRHVAADDLMLPNLAPQPPPFVRLWDAAGERVVQFATVVTNWGGYPLDILGTTAGDPDQWRAHQCVRWAERACLDREEVGSLIWHADHQHWHFDDFAGYELRHLDGDGGPDYSPGGLIATNSKVSFCLQDSRPEGDDRIRFYSGCLGAIQGISPGWSDIYGAALPGQSLPVEGLADGRYAIVVTVDPLDRLLESDDGDNTAFAVIELSGGATAVRLVES